MVAVRLKSAFAFTALALTAAAAPAAANDYASAKNGRIAFLAQDVGVMTIGPNGSGPVRALTYVPAAPAAVTHPVFTPSGRQLAFSVQGGCLNPPPGTCWDGEAALGSLDGRRIQSILRLPPGWGPLTDLSPDGRSYLYDAAGLPVRGEVKGKESSASFGPGRDAVFSPDGRIVAVASDPYLGGGIRMAPSRGGAGAPLTSPPPGSFDQEPSFSSDGSRIAFERYYNSPYGQSEIFVVNVDGSGLTNLTAATDLNLKDPDFSPDGTALVLGGERLMRIESDGTGLTTLSALPSQDPNWGPIFRCGGRIATIVGDDGPDRITGTKRADVIVGNAGPDRIDGRGGRDRICGGLGNDRLLGGAARDKLVGGPGRDSSSQ